MPLPRNIRNRNNKFDKNVTKRGNVDIGKAAEKDDKGPGISKPLIAFFLFVVVGSSIVQVLNMFARAPPPPPMEAANPMDGIKVDLGDLGMDASAGAAEAAADAAAEAEAEAGAAADP